MLDSVCLAIFTIFFDDIVKTPSIATEDCRLDSVMLSELKGVLIFYL